MEVLWFCLIAVMITVYVVLDGFDLGAGIVHLLLARATHERAQILRTIGPVWDGNEVWLLAGGGTLYLAFPALYSAAFSGFYLALMLLLWLLILRGIAIEFRNHIESAVWQPFWDFLFGGASAVLALVFGVALGNVVRGVPLDNSAFFFLPLWVDLRVGGLGAGTGIIDWYTLLVGITAFTALALHGCLWIALKTTDTLSDRSRAFAARLWRAILFLTLAITWFSFHIQPNLGARYRANPWGFGFPAIALAGLAGIYVLNRRRQDFGAFLASCVFLLGLLTSAAFGVFPYVLPSNGELRYGLTVYNAAAAPYGLSVGLWWWIPGMALATAYSLFAYRRLAGKVMAG